MSRNCAVIELPRPREEEEWDVVEGIAAEGEGGEGGTEAEAVVLATIEITVDDHVFISCVLACTSLLCLISSCIEGVAISLFFPYERNCKKKRENTHTHAPQTDYRERTNERTKSYRMSSGFDPDVDDFFAQMVAEESHKVAQVTRIVRSNRQRTRERLQHVTAATNASQHSPSSSPSSSSLPSSNNAALEDRNPYTLRTALGDLLKSAASANTRMQTRQDAMRTVRATVATLPRDLLRVVFVPSVYEPLIELFRDGFFREAAISVMLDMVETLKQDAQSCLGILLPVLKGRWQKRYNMFVEGSEEVRLLLLRLTTSLVRHCSTAIGEFPSYLDDLCDTILVNAYSDYHHVKEVRCRQDFKRFLCLRPFTLYWSCMIT